MPVRTLLLVAPLVWAASVRAQSVPVGSCERGTATVSLETSSLIVPLFNDGRLFFDFDDSDRAYRLRRDPDVSPTWWSNLWLSGYVSDSVRVAAAAYGKNEFWPGPLADADAPPADCSAWDRVWVVSREDVARYLATGEATADLAEWPHEAGAPVLDGDGDPTNYDLAAGDQPDLVGDVAAFWVMNDAGNEHTGTRAAPLGAEVRALAFAFETSPLPVVPVEPLRETLFLRYEVVNRRSVAIDSLRLSLWSDVDLGFFNDDYVGSDSLRHTVFVYNADDLDDGPSGFGAAPPAWGTLFLRGLPAESNGRDDDYDGAVDEAGERAGLSTAPPAPKNTPFGTGDPYRAAQFVNMQRGRFDDGTPVIAYGYGHVGYGFDTPLAVSPDTTVFGYPASPLSGEHWSARNADGAGGSIRPGDRRMVGTTGPATLGPGQSVVVDLAFPLGRGANHLDSVSHLLALSEGYLAAFGNGFPARPVLPTAPPAPPTTLAVTRVRPNPASGGQAAVLSLPDPTPIEAVVLDVLGRRVAVVASGTLPAGEIPLAIPDDLTPGAYLLRVTPDRGRPTTLPFTVLAR